MKRILTAGILLLTLAGTVGAQDLPLPQVMERLRLGRQEQQEVQRLVQESRETIQKTRIELEVIKAQLRKQLFDREVDMEDVKRLLRQGLEWEYRERLAQIELQVELRKLMSDQQYFQLRQIWSQRRQDGAE